MSNIGKTYWAERLAAEAGFEHVNCDALIGEKLISDFKENIVAYDIAAWMGQPYEARYGAASQKYMDSENAVMQTIITRLRGAKLTRPLAIDTSGSVIYANKDILRELAALTRIVYLETSTEHTAELFRRYIEHPKPVIWGGAFIPRANEAPTEALQRCYPLLLNDRAGRYAEIAGIRVPFEQHEDPQAGPDIFMRR